MRLEDVAALAQVAAVLVATIAILVSLKGIRDQLWMFTYAEYTRRYGEIMDALPFQARRPGDASTSSHSLWPSRNASWGS